MEKITFRLSSTALGKSACSLNLCRTVIDGYREKFMSARIVYGIAVHKFIDTMYKTGSMGLAVVNAKKAFDLPKTDIEKSLHLSDFRHLQTVAADVWSYCVLDSTYDVLSIDGKPMTEQTFSFKIYEDDFIVVYLEGTLDKLGQFKGGCFAIGDWKTTSSWDNVGYFEQFELSRQLRVYRLATILAHRADPDSTLGRIGGMKCGVFIDGVFLKPDPNECKVKRSRVYMISDEEMHKFEVMLHLYCKELSFKVQYNRMENMEGTLNGSCEGKWGKCSFWNVCQAPANVKSVLLSRDFNKVEWKPSDYNNLNDEV